jgi:hypothetical protein
VYQTDNVRNPTAESSSCELADCWTSRRDYRNLFDEGKWRTLWTLLGAGALLVIAVLILCVRLFLLNRA